MFQYVHTPLAGKKEITVIAERFQENLHEMIEYSKKENPKLEYQDLVTTFMLYKLAEMQYQINILFNN